MTANAMWQVQGEQLADRKPRSWRDCLDGSLRRARRVPYDLISRHTVAVIVVQRGGFPRAAPLLMGDARVEAMNS